MWEPGFARATRFFVKLFFFFITHIFVTLSVARLHDGRVTLRKQPRFSKTGSREKPHRGRCSRVRGGTFSKWPFALHHISTQSPNYPIAYCRNVRKIAAYIGKLVFNPAGSQQKWCSRQQGKVPTKMQMAVGFTGNPISDKRIPLRHDFNSDL